MGLRQKLPSTGALFMFEAAARLGSFTLAAREFNVTQPAVSRMVGRLEAHLGTRLFHRHTGGLRLTADGELLQRAINEGFGRIEGAVDALQRRQQDAAGVTISVTSAFAIHWLMPRYDRFRQQLPNVTLRLELIHGEPEGPLAGADLGIRFGSTQGVEGEPLVDEVIIPVCSPVYLERHGRIDGPAGLSGHTIATLSGLPLRIPWATFLEAVGSRRDAKANELAFADYALVIQAAIKGQAVALGWWHVVADEIASGGLVPAGAPAYRTGATYSLVRSVSVHDNLFVAAVSNWLVAEFRELDQRLADLAPIGPTRSESGSSASTVPV